MSERKQLTEKFREAVASVLPITLIVTIVCFSFVPVTTDLMLSFLIGSVLLIVGMALFTLGSEVSMTQIGTHMGAKLTKSRKLWLILTVSFLLGVAITVAEPICRCWRQCAKHRYHGADYYRIGGRGHFSAAEHAAHFAGDSAAVDAAGLLCADFYFGRAGGQGFPGRGL